MLPLSPYSWISGEFSGHRKYVKMLGELDIVFGDTSEQEGQEEVRRTVASRGYYCQSLPVISELQIKRWPPISV